MTELAKTKLAKTDVAAGQSAAPPAVAEHAVSGDALLAMIERAARDPAVDVVKMERLFEMQERASVRHAQEAFLSALALMQCELPPVARMGTGHNAKKYARFEDIIAAVMPVLSRHGFSLTYRVKQDEKSMTITGVLGHARGHSEQTEMTLPQDLSGNKNPVQAWGSSASYGKRYVTLTLLGIATEDEDDDGKRGGGGATITEAQEERLRAMLDEVEADLPAFCKYFRIDRFCDLKAVDFDRAVKTIDSKKSRRA